MHEKYIMLSIEALKKFRRLRARRVTSETPCAHGPPEEQVTALQYTRSLAHNIAGNNVKAHLGCMAWYGRDKESLDEAKLADR